MATDPHHRAPLHRPLRHDDIAAECGERYFERGMRYFADERVLQIDRLEWREINRTPVVSFEATVVGSGRRHYHQEISIRWIGEAAVIEGYCSCPMEFNCKHVAAVCLAFSEYYLSAPAGTANSAEDWLSALQAAGRKTATPSLPEPGETFVFYLLTPGKAPGRVVAHLGTVRRKKRGGLGKPTPRTLYDLQNPYHGGRHLSKGDHEIVHALAVSDPSGWGSVQVQGVPGGMALRRMVESGRCYWEHLDEEKTLRWSERKASLKLEWREDEQGYFRLIVEADGADRILATDPPHYLNISENTIGPLDSGGFTSEQLLSLLAAPALSRKQAVEFSRTLLLNYPDLALPPPVEIAVGDLSGVTPTPVLTLQQGMLQGVPVHLAQLEFDYQGHRVAALPAPDLQTLATPEGLLRIHRDLDAEQLAEERLLALDMLPLRETSGTGLAFHFPDERPLENIARWHRFLEETCPELEAAGWRIVRDAELFQLAFDEPEGWHGELDESSDNGWFEMALTVELDGEELPLLPLLGPVLEAYDPETLPERVAVPLEEHRYLMVPGAALKPWMEVLIELFDRAPPSEEKLRLSRFDSARLAEMEAQSDIQWRGGEAIRRLGQRLRDFRNIAQVPPPEGFTGKLRAYQQQGYDWLHFLREYELGGILADDMGLGKTVQTLAFLASLKEEGKLDRPALVIAPTSLMGNWAREAAQFTPGLRVLVLHGPERHERYPRIPEHDLVLTTYPLLPRDQEKLLEQRFSLLVLDEAQTIKNAKSQAARIVRRIRADQRLCLTGTPMENHLGELWAQFDFLMPGFLGDSARFKRLYRTPIEKHGDQDAQARLARRVAPFMLRRRKDEVATELPPKTELIRSVPLGKSQAALYESIRASMEKKVRDAIAAKGLARSHITILDALLKLRQVCCDPRLLKLKQAQKIGQSAKLEMLMELLPEMLEEGRRILLFSQFTSMLGLIEKELKARGISWTKLTGQTRKRDAAIERFTSGEVNLFLISLKAGGVGLNLTAADTVVLYDPWWNPAVESQAMDRAHRIGQDKPVFVYKLLTEGTVEERILALQERKRALAEGIYRKKEGAGEPLTPEDLEVLFEPLE